MNKLLPNKLANLFPALILFETGESRQDKKKEKSRGMGGKGAGWFATSERDGVVCIVCMYVSAFCTVRIYTDPDAWHGMTWHGRIPCILIFLFLQQVTYQRGHFVCLLIFFLLVRLTIAYRLVQGGKKDGFAFYCFFNYLPCKVQEVFRRKGKSLFGV